ncbi:Uncharacterized conserved protein, DUF1330 family [Roseovarius lutimaris]|uniref:Uncharacterized conserved protein, DUF1330 family n=1 Tax=Roseovarius lutimaris TaxID=1005928 RepID=A0A1I5CES7_9RHOB|nr:DUF1330 domain-containing protein [Roseovarius lutimaris]SFN85433.1 Uncharacterized conserved protein, DUF1330 family [Roseovarius lutimaris]
MSAYIIARINVTDAEDYKNYAGQTVALAEKFGGKYLVKGGAQTQLEGNGPDRHVLIEFPDRETALEWYNSDAYRRILPIAISSSDRDIVVVDGL